MKIPQRERMRISDEKKRFRFDEILIEYFPKLGLSQTISISSIFLLFASFHPFFLILIQWNLYQYLAVARVDFGGESTEKKILPEGYKEDKTNNQIEK